MSFIPRVAGTVGGALLGGVPGALIGSQFNKKDKMRRDPMADPYYKPQDGTGSTGGVRSGRGSSSLSM